MFTPRPVGWWPRIFRAGDAQARALAHCVACEVVLQHVRMRQPVHKRMCICACKQNRLRIKAQASACIRACACAGTWASLQGLRQAHGHANVFSRMRTSVSARARNSSGLRSPLLSESTSTRVDWLISSCIIFIKTCWIVHFLKNVYFSNDFSLEFYVGSSFFGYSYQVQICML